MQLQSGFTTSGLRIFYDDKYFLINLLISTLKMKKSLIFSMFAATMLLATSCQQDEVFVDNSGAVVTFEISTPEIATRAFSDGATATQLQYAVYDADLKLVDREGLKGTEQFNNKKANIQMDLAAGKTYNVLFWAAAPDAPYTINYDKLVMNVSYEGAVSNAENRDAFYCFKNITVKQGNESVKVILTRPFAQLNIGTDDLEKLDGVSAQNTQVAVPVYSTLDLVNGTATGNVETETFAFAGRPQGETFPVADYEYLAMNYLLVGNDKTVVDVEFSYGTAESNNTRTFTSIPVRANYRTNIYGSLLTNNVGFDVEIEEDYNNKDNINIINVSNVEELFNALNNRYTYTLINLVNNINLGSSTIYYVREKENLTISANNKTIIAGGNNTDAASFSISGENNINIKNATIIGGSFMAFNGANVVLDRVNITYNSSIYNYTTWGKSMVVAGSDNEKVTTITIKDGNFTMSDMDNGNGRSYLHAAGNSIIYVEGGNFTGKPTNSTEAPIIESSIDNYRGQVIISGGSFNFNPSKIPVYNNNQIVDYINCVAEGYTTIQENGIWRVIKNIPTIGTQFEVDGLYYNIISNNEVEITFPGNTFYGNHYIGRIVIPEVVYNNGYSYNVTTIGYRAFACCEDLNIVVMPNSITTIKDDAFFQSYNLTGAIIPHNVTHIGEYAFCDTGLMYVYIPENIESIGLYAFALCDNIKEVTCYAKTPPSIFYTFQHSPTEILYVPAGCKGAYEADDEWKRFTNIIERDF